MRDSISAAKVTPIISRYRRQNPGTESIYRHCCPFPSRSKRNGRQLNHRFNSLPPRDQRTPGNAAESDKSVSQQHSRLGWFRKPARQFPSTPGILAPVNCNDAACTFSSRCTIDVVPGMGSIIGDRLSNPRQCYLDRFHLAGLRNPLQQPAATVPAPSGNHGMKAIALRSQ